MAVFPDGSLATSIGVSESAVWLRDRQGDHPITSTGAAAPAGSQGMSSRPMFARDGKHLYYLLRSQPLGLTVEIWRYDLESGQREAVLSGFAIDDYDISNDGQEAVLLVQPPGQSSELWLARLGRTSPPQRIAAAGEASPHFGPDDEILFRLSEGGAFYVARMNKDGSARAKLAQYSISTVTGLSWDRRWLAVFMPQPGAPMASFARCARERRPATEAVRRLLRAALGARRHVGVLPAEPTVANRVDEDTLYCRYVPARHCLLRSTGPNRMFWMKSPARPSSTAERNPRICGSSDSAPSWIRRCSPM